MPHPRALSRATPLHERARWRERSRRSPLDPKGGSHSPRTRFLDVGTGQCYNSD